MIAQQKIAPLMMIAVALIWGGTFIAGRQLPLEIPPLVSAFFRFFIACIVLVFFLHPGVGIYN